MTNPIDVIANAIRGVNGSADYLAATVAVALTDEQVVANAAQALLDDAEARQYDSPLGGTIAGWDPEKLAELARIVLASVGGTS